MMAEIRSPFNFLPVNNRVYYPEWANLITQDIPFGNGICGSLEVTITADTPIFVRNGHTKADMEKQNDVYQSFCKFPDGRYFIPGTSVKGAIRSVLEVLSMGKVHVDEHAMFAWPRLDKGAKVDMKNICCGWLHRRADDTYYISVCKGKPCRIALWEIDKLFDTHTLEEHFSSECRFNLNQETKLNDTVYDPKSAAYKYALLSSVGDLSALCNLSFSPGDKDTYIPDADGYLQGTIVLTGQPDQKKNWGTPNTGMGQGKWKEFIFPDEIDYTIELDEEVYSQYKSLYKDSPDWAFRFKDIDTKGMPVFLRVDRGKLIDFGLTFMYKVPYTNTPKDLTSKYELQKDDKNYRPDLAECIFGYISKKDSLKGRVQFSNFVSENAEEDQACCLVLNGPKASYYPIYIRQENGRNGFVNAYQNYNNGEIAGRKRYLLRDTTWQRKAESDKVNTVINPLKAGSQFKGTIHFHNLRPEELGALLSALTFHGNPQCHHQLGQAKPYGFGKVTVTLDSIRTPSYAEYPLREDSFYMALFEKKMCAFHPAWRHENAITELLTIAAHAVKGNDAKYQYMIMGMEKDANEFDHAKKAKLYLEDFSRRIGKSVTPASLYASYKDELDGIEAEMAKRRAEAKQREIERKAEELRKEEEQRAKDEAEALAQRKAEKSEAGLSVLDEKRADGKGYKVTSFKQAKNKIDGWMKVAQVTSVPADQQATLFATLQRLHATPDKSDKKNWGIFESKLWKEIAAYTSDDTAKKWFDELNA